MKKLLIGSLLALSLADLNGCVARVAVGPPEARVEVRGVAPYASAVWVPGHYRRNWRHQWVWVAGYWR